ncbi:MAG: 23S rRNA (uracil(1939)-C(5))-methyltransferase RlmD [Acutalibacteraceae bacterium]|nr:23S rRNA (uracil(1939)-C(5))-methyltransferase RlmD [Acutalibacteraceae bacterium]
MIKKNDIVALTIEDITGQGSGIGRIDGMAVFVPLTAIGDIINARILKVKKNYAYAKIENIITPSQSRITPDCGCYTKCGGCVFRHISYEEELKIKHRRVYDAVTRIGKIENFKMNYIVGAKNPNEYRNKSQIPFGYDKDHNIITGFYGTHSHRITGDGTCKLHPAEFDEITAIVNDWAKRYRVSVYDEINHSGLIRHLYLRYAAKNEQIMVCMVINGKKLPYKDELINELTKYSTKIKSIILNVNTEKTNVVLGKKCETLYGSDHITDILCELSFDISPLSFYQVNRDQAEVLYGIAKNYAAVGENDFLIDLYCGTGTIGLTMADKAKNVLGIEIIPQAIENAKKNAKMNGIDNAEFICSDAKTAAQDLAKKKTLPDVVVIDPPRKGCDKEVIESVCIMNPKRIVYVSCDPETLARDLALFEEKGYKTKEVTPVDMFPRTQHVETVVLMTAL